MKKVKTPSAYDRARCFDLRCRSKRGEYINSEDHAFVSRMFKKYPEWYSVTEKDVFNATVPFGSAVRRKK